MLKTIFLTVLMVSMCCVCAQKASAQETPQKIRIGYLNLVNAQLVAKHFKMHEKEMGVEVEWYRFNSGRDVNTAMAGNSLDFGNIGLPPCAIGLSGKMNYWGIMNANMLGAVEALIVRDNVKSLKDLEGKTVIAPFGATTHFLLMKALKEANVDMSKVKVMDMAPGEALAPFVRGDIDAAYIWEPSLGLVAKNGGKILLTSEEMAKRGYATWDILTVQPEFAQKYPELVKKFIKTELRAMRYWYEHPEETAKIIAKELGGISIADAKRMMAGTHLAELDEQLSPAMFGSSTQKGKHVEEILNVAEFLLGQKRIKNPVTREMAESYLHPEFLEAVKAEGFK